jgi:hypothetical protein
MRAAQGAARNPQFCGSVNGQRRPGTELISWDHNLIDMDMDFC